MLCWMRGWMLCGMRGWMLCGMRGWMLCGMRGWMLCGMLGFESIEYNIVLELNENGTMNAVSGFIKNSDMAHVSVCQ
jgi:hypothetical protein